MNWRSSRFFIALIFFCTVLLIVLFISFHAFNVKLSSNQNISSTKVVVPPLPAPGSARTIYTNATFNYTIHYPTQWFLTTTGNTSLVRVFMRHDLSVPEAVAFEITCFANPNQLDGKAFWQQSQPVNGSENGIGPMTFSSGASSYVAKGQGQTPYTVYTLVNKQVACQIVTMQSDPANMQVVLSVVSSFHW